jgi:3,4-dihydroxy 2-butanone 4-phosphate synthase/GTP cyclohydrolase II
MPQKPVLQLAQNPEEIRAAIASVEAAVEDIRAGKLVILVDDADRENEGDLCMAAEKVTPEAINFMARYGRGLICLSMTEHQLDQLNLGMMVPDWENTSGFGTAFTVSIEARRGVTTGISAADRATTILTAIAADAKPSRARATCSRCALGRAACCAAPVRPRARSISRGSRS